MIDADNLMELLRKIQEPKGFFFNNDQEQTRELLAALLINKNRYGSMTCPCRLASGNPEWDKDIICPCVYREPDIREFGSCYCSLYVTRDWNAGKTPRVYVPERRPQEKMRF
ncbi:MAG: ferredoxin:thioredoxin reductase [Deltaproteobacteria bacterium RIFOXYD12_FULL_50_9]|nr:MAG: ferredoxin:thioredoxin reductase [Deltaproteobacteria bacterium RIFOXYD12_FULL_50_9]